MQLPPRRRRLATLALLACGTALALPPGPAVRAADPDGEGLPARAEAPAAESPEIAGGLRATAGPEDAPATAAGRLAPAVPQAAAAYASADPSVPLPFPVPDAAVAPRAPVPSVPDPGRPTPAVEVDAPALRNAIDAYRRGKVEEGDRLRDALADPAQRALLDWVAIRSGAGIGFERIVAFIRDNPDWPAGAVIRRRAEEALLSQRKAPGIVRAYFAARRPASPPGKFALALALKADGLDEDAAALARDLWREDGFGRTLELKVLDAFPGAITEVDHRARMERALMKEDWEAAGRAATYAGKSYGTLVRARRAVEAKAANAQSLLDAVPPSLRGDSSFLFSRAQLLRRLDRPAEAAAVLMSAPRNPEVLVDPDEWWIERRIVARKLLDQGDARNAYAVVAGHSARAVEKRIEAEFHAGWIALRFLQDAALGARHFAAAAAVAETPISIARAAYWQGRAAEALNQPAEARTFYERAAAQPIAYYGQLARAKLGQDTLALRHAAPLDEAARRAFEARPVIRALRFLAAAGLREQALPLYIDLAHRLSDPAELAALGDVAAADNDPRALVALGKVAVQRGLPLDQHAYPVNGIPSYEAFSAVPQVERAMVFAIARQESQFDPKAQSSVGARGLMQMMPATAQRTARRVSAAFDAGRLLSDPAYNARLGQAHLGELMEDWRGSYILAFASYNAGGGNVKKWIDAYGDPRDPRVDPIDWVERIPFTETRNYVQRVTENLQVYRSRLEGRSALLIESDLHRGGR
ncbi:Lytic transglycosylase catalytic [Methylobacterium sp. 4-46]|uniref:lytic transglycosylase domain-containing protein n=1 Tax=unclassified Methylobacterium TaxID=2615210 RepID=UPI000152E250|nr:MULTISPECIES: lytic transglycosylase domain-containing protein [Methylobacterium]ACA15258.1 Lytic transglycosylase catalytic [Methylobacterium sp. 4-46]WFT80986.1 transglycosylase SLT domain-containing protein [Methylobacterium nodulans]